MAIREKILIAGFSGSGKTTLLNALKNSAPEGWELFDDLDQLILKDLRGKFKTLAQYIETVGWEEFRKKERQIFEGWIKDEDKGVLALGGGTVTPLLLELFGKARKLQWVYLEADFKTCWDRLIKDQDREPRPLVKLGEIALEKIYLERKMIFEQIPFKLQNTNSTSMEMLASTVWLEVGTSR